MDNHLPSAHHGVPTKFDMVMVIARLEPVGDSVSGQDTSCSDVVNIETAATLCIS